MMTGCRLSALSAVSLESALAKAETVATEMEGRRLKAAANCLREGIGKTTTYLLPGYPAGRRRRIRHEQHDRTAQPGDQAAHARGRRFP